MTGYESAARLIWQIYVERMVEAGLGDRVYVWEGLPAAERASFVSAVGIVMRQESKAAVKALADHLRLGVEVR